MLSLWQQSMITDCRCRNIPLRFPGCDMRSNRFHHPQKHNHEDIPYYLQHVRQKYAFPSFPDRLNAPTGIQLLRLPPPACHTLSEKYLRAFCDPLRYIFSYVPPPGLIQFKTSFPQVRQYISNLPEPGPPKDPRWRFPHQNIFYNQHLQRKAKI